MTTMKILAKAGIDILNANESGTNALHLAAKKKYSEMVKMLVDSGYPLDV